MVLLPLVTPKLESAPAIVEKDQHEIELASGNRRLFGF